MASMNIEGFTRQMPSFFFFLSFFLLQMTGIGCQDLRVPPGYEDINYCRPNVTVPEKPVDICGTCELRCGEPRDFSTLDLCSCDDKCKAYGDCCYDFEEICSKEHTEGLKISNHFKFYGSECVMLLTVDSLENGLFETQEKSSYFMFISVCGDTGEVCESSTTSNFSDPNLALPVTDPTTGLVYINYRCAKCNSVSRIEWWMPSLLCDPEYAFFQEGLTLIKDSETLARYQQNCTVIYTMPNGTAPRRGCDDNSINRITSCPKSCANTQLVQRCEFSPFVDYVNIKNNFQAVYENLYCAFCNDAKLTNLECGFIFPFQPEPGPSVERFSLSLLFDFNPDAGLVVGQRPCAPGEQRVGVTQKCRQLACPTDRRLVEGACLPFNVRVRIVSAMLYFTRANDAQLVESTISKRNLTFTMRNHMNAKLQNLMSSNPAKEAELKITLMTHIENELELNISIYAEFSFGLSSKFNLDSDVLFVTAGAEIVFKAEIEESLTQSNIRLLEEDIIIDGELTFTENYLTDCSWSWFTEDEYDIGNNSLVLEETGQSLTPERYRLAERKALICIEKDPNATRVDLDVSKALGIITIVLIALSIICLLVRIVLQCILSYYNNFAARLQFNLALALCLAFLMLLVGGIIGLLSIQPLCAAAGVLMYWFFLAAFSWMSAIALDTWLVFRPSHQFVRADNTQTSLLRYALPCWIVPAILAIIVIGLDFANFDKTYRANFGVNICWFNQRYALLIYFATPVAITILTSAMFFIFTVKHIRNRISDSARKKGDAERQEFWIYIRLFALMGVTWVFGFVAPFVGHDALWIIFIIFNASQGVLIFISFVLRKAVLDEIKNKCKTKTNAQQTNSSDLQMRTTDSGTRST